jgi:uncharacterized protein (DUF302 family)
MLTKVNVERFSVLSSRPFREVLEKLQAAVGHPDMASFWTKVRTAKTNPEMEKVIEAALGPSGFMEFTRFDHGGVVHKGQAGETPGIVRLVVGNPLIMRQMVKHVADAGSYAPVTILVDERRDGVRLSYDRMASLLAPYGNPEALKVAQDLDAKVERLLTAAAG